MAQGTRLWPVALQNNCIAATNRSSLMEIVSALAGKRCDNRLYGTRRDRSIRVAKDVPECVHLAKLVLGSIPTASRHLTPNRQRGATAMQPASALVPCQLPDTDESLLCFDRASNSAAGIEGLQVPDISGG